MRRLAPVVVVVVLAVVSAGCANPNPTAEMRIWVDEFSIRFSPRTAQDEGAVKMFVDNVGQLEHSLFFVRAKSASELPLAPDGSVDLAKAQVADQLKPFGPGKYRIAPEFFPGPLVIFCNLVTKGPDGQPISHFQRGMRREFGINDTRANDVPGPP